MRTTDKLEIVDKEEKMTRRIKQTTLLLTAIFVMFCASVTVHAARTMTQNAGGTTKNAVAVNWQNVAQTLKAEYSSYKEVNVTSITLKWGTSSSAMTGSVVLAPNTTSYVISGLQPATSYRAELYWTGSYVSSGGYSYDRKDVYVEGTSIYTAPGMITGLGDYDYMKNQKGFEILWSVPAGGNAGRGIEYQIVSTGGKILASGTETVYMQPGAQKIFSLSSFSGYKQVARIHLRGYSTLLDGSTKVYGEWSAWKNLVPQPIVNTNTKKYGINTKNWTMKLAFSRVAGAKSYTIKISTKAKSGYKKVATVKQKSKKTIKYTVNKYKGAKFKSQKHYYVQIITNAGSYGKSRGAYYTDFYTRRYFKY